MSFSFPLVLSSAGAVPQSPASIQQQLLAAVAATNPGYTGDLPASLIEDISSTDVAAIVLCDQARVELINSLTPAGANAFLLAQLGQVYGLTPGLAANTSVNVVFSGTVGYVISAGFQVSDGTNIYQLADGGVIGADGQSASLTAIAVTEGSWPVPAATVTQITTSVPSSITLTVTNPLSGTPGGDAETEQSFRARVMQAGLAPAQGMTSYLKTALQQLPGVVSRLVGVIATIGSGIEVLCGGGDNYQIANAIFNAVFDPSALLGSTTHVVVTNPSTVATLGSSTGGSLPATTYYVKYTYGDFSGETLPSPESNLAVAANNVLTVTSPASATGAFYWNAYVSDATGTETLQQENIPIGTNWTLPTTGLVVGAALPTTNTTADATITVSLNNYPDTYQVIFVAPVEQVVTMVVTWNTRLADFAQGSAVDQITVQPLIDWINQIGVGAPINLLDLYSVFETAVTGVLDVTDIIKLDFVVSINGNVVAPVSGETIINSDPEGYFSAAANAVTVTQG